MNKAGSPGVDGVLSNGTRAMEMYGHGSVNKDTGSARPPRSSSGASWIHWRGHRRVLLAPWEQIMLTL